MSGGTLYRAWILELRARCTHARMGIVSKANVLVAYANSFNAYLTSTRKANFIFAYLNRHFIPCAMEASKDPQYMALSDATVRIWRDVVLRHCIGLLVRGAAGDGMSPNHVAAVLESSQRFFTYAGDDGEFVHFVPTTLVELEQRLHDASVIFKPCPFPWWTKQTHDECDAGTRATVHTLLLVRERFKVCPPNAAAVSLPQDSLLATWQLIASFLPR